MQLKLTPALRRIMEFIERGGDHGRMELQICASGGKSASQLSTLILAGYVERFDGPKLTKGYAPGRVCLTDAGKTALAEVARRREGKLCR